MKQQKIIDWNKDRENRLEELLYQEEAEGERRVQKTMFFVLIFSAIVVGIFAIYTRPFYRNYPDFILIGLLSGYNFLITSIVKRGAYKPAIKYFTMFIPITLISFTMISSGIINNSWAHGVNSDIIIVHFIVISVSGVYHRTRLPVLTGLVAAFEYSLIYGYAVFFGGAKLALENVSYYEPTVSGIQLFTICAALVAFGFVVSFIAKLMTMVLRKSLDSEVEFEHLEKMNQAIEETNRQKTNFFVNVAHESKTPLTLIRNYLSKYINRKGSGSDLKVVQKNVNKLLRDMVNFMDVEKLEKGTLVYDHSCITPFSELLKTGAPLFKELGVSKNIVLTTEIEDGIYIKADGSALDRIVNNLITNALRYTSEGGGVLVTLKAEGDVLIFSVLDTGIGIPADRIDHIFTPYYQLSHTKQNSQGIGMGLAIVKQIVDSLEGTIRVNSVVGQGSLFSVILKRYDLGAHDRISHNRSGENAQYADIGTPVTEAFYQPGEDTVSSPGGGTLSGSLLIVEDNRDLLNYIAGILGKHYRVYTAGNGKRALTLLEKIPKPDVIISDIMMDGMDGQEFFHTLIKKGKFQDIPFIFLTAQTALEDEIAALNRGAVDFIHKPFNPQVILAKVGSIIDNRNLRQALFEKEKFSTLGMLAGGISQEIVDPLQNIRDNLGGLKRIFDKNDMKDAEKAGRYLGTIGSNTDRLTGLIKRLQYIYQNKNFQKREINLKEAGAGIIKRLRDKTPDYVRFHLEVEESFMILGDPSVLTRILTNLASNALDAVAESGKGEGDITIKGIVSEGLKKIVVADNGCGIPLKHGGNIFNAFFSGKEVGKGAGMGLFIVKSLVLKMGWTIDFTSKMGKGSEFTITCP